jgi:hypothetical protein
MHQARPADGMRRGVATLWVIVAVPVLLTLLVVVGDVANLRLARIEAENAVEAAALASVKHWHEGGDSAPHRHDARATAVVYAAANTVVGQPVVIGANEGPSDDNDNASPAGDVVLGKITGSGLLTFNHSSSPDPGEFGVHVHANVAVPSLFSSFGGFSFGPYSVFVQATALYDGAGEVRLVRVQSFTP